MAEIRVNSTGGVKLFDADDSHYAQIKAGTITSNTDVLTLGHDAVVAGTKVDLNGQELILDADADTSITADTDDQIDVRIAGADDFQFTANTFTAQSGSSIVVPDGGLTFGSTAISSTAAELNLLDGGTSVGSSITVADADGFVVNDGGTMKTIPATDVKTYAGGAITALNNATENELVSVGSTTTELDAEGGLTTDGSTLTIKPGSNVHQLKLEQNNATDYWSFHADSSGGPLTIQRYTGGAETERFRIESDGALHSITTDTDGHQITGNYTSGNNTLFHFKDGQSQTCGHIDMNAGDNTVSYNTSSDYRLKENVANLTDGITRLKQLKPYRFNWKSNPSGNKVDGFFAHEVKAVIDEAVTRDKDLVDDGGNMIVQGIDQSKLVPLLTAALQEAITEIESLKARVTTLEG